MGRKIEKLIARFLSFPYDFHYDEIIILLKHFGFEKVKSGKTSGSRIKFKNTDGRSVVLHRPHPSGIMKQYQMKQIKELLKL